MFGKLMKYELRYLIRIFAPMWVIVLGLCLLWRIATPADIFFMDELSERQAMVMVILTMVSVMGLITMSVVAAVVLIQRMYKGMYGDEGYLILTLPVSTNQIINAKVLSGSLMLIGTGLITVVSVLVFTAYGELWSSVWEEASYMLDLVGYSVGELVMLGFWLLVMIVAGTLQSMYLLVFTISAGQLWKKHPIIGAVLVYYGLQVLGMSVTNVTARLFGENIITAVMELVNGYGMQDITGMILYMIGSALLAAVISLLCFLGTKLLLDRKLNIA